MATKTGRPLGFALQAVQELVDAAGARGLTVVEAREKLPGYNAISIKSALHNLHRRYGYQMITGVIKCGVFVSPGVSENDAEAAYAQRVAEDTARQREIAKAARKRYERRIAEEKRAKRRGDLEAAAKARAERNAKLERERQARQAEREAAQRDKLHASQRAEISATNRLAKRLKGDGTYDSNKPQPTRCTVETWGNVQVQKIPHQPGRYEVLTAPPTFTGKELLPPASCMAKALG